MTKEQALSRLRGLWYKYQINHLAALQGAYIVNESTEEARGDYYGYKKALIDMGVITYKEGYDVEEDKLILKEKAA